MHWFDDVHIHLYKCTCTCAYHCIYASFSMVSQSFLVPKPRKKGRTFGCPLQGKSDALMDHGEWPKPWQDLTAAVVFSEKPRELTGGFPKKKWISLAPWPDMARYGQLSLLRCVFGEAFRASLHRSLVGSIPCGRCLVLAGPMSQETFV